MTVIHLYSRQGHCSFREGGTVTGVDWPLRELVFCNNTSIISYVHSALTRLGHHAGHLPFFPRDATFRPLYPTWYHSPAASRKRGIGAGLPSPHPIRGGITGHASRHSGYQPAKIRTPFLSTTIDYYYSTIVVLVYSTSLAAASRSTGTTGTGDSVPLYTGISL